MNYDEYIVNYPDWIKKVRDNVVLLFGNNLVNWDPLILIIELIKYRIGELSWILYNVISVIPILQPSN